MLPLYRRHAADLFQFLIGTLKTMLEGADKAPTYAFQFLICTLKTTRIQEWLEGPDTFQFLIGTLKTAKNYAADCRKRRSFNSS